MKASVFKEFLQKIPDEAYIVISKAIVIDNEEDITAVLDIPVLGMALGTESNGEVELRFVLDSKGAKSVFSKDELTIIKDLDDLKD